jgi:hypothetical protein
MLRCQFDKLPVNVSYELECGYLMFCQPQSSLDVSKRPQKGERDVKCGTTIRATALMAGAG